MRDRFLGGGVRERRGVSVRLVREMDRLQDLLGVLERDLVNFLLFRGERLSERRGVRLRLRGLRVRLRVRERGVRERGERDRERERDREYDRDRGLL